MPSPVVFHILTFYSDKKEWVDSKGKKFEPKAMDQVDVGSSDNGWIQDLSNRGFDAVRMPGGTARIIAKKGKEVT